MGGLSKKAFKFNKIRKETPLPTLTIDAGRLLFGTTHISNNLLPQAKITAEGIVKAYNLMGYNAVNITSRDLAAGVDYLQKLTAISNFAWLSANFVNKKDARPLFRPYITITLGAHNAAIIGLTAPDRLDSKQIGPDNEILAWDAVLPQVLDSIRESHDFIVLLTDLPRKTCKEIATKYPSINLIIMATGSASNYQPELLAPSTLIAASGKQGKYFGIMTVNVQKNAPWAIDRERMIADKKRELDRLKWQIDRYKERPELKTRYNNLLKMAEKTRAKIDELQELLAKDQAKGGKRSSFENGFVDIVASIPDDRPVQKVVTQIKSSISEIGKLRNNTNPTAKNQLEGYTGWRKCGECHPRQLSTWQNSRHAKAYLTLIEKNQQFNRKCVYCHVTGVTAEIAEVALSLPPELQHVGCESCHGAGAAHARNPTIRKILPITEKVCKGCHIPEHDDNFNFDRDITNLHCQSSLIQENKS